jgi:hypothetical protein
MMANWRQKMRHVLWPSISPAVLEENSRLFHGLQGGDNVSLLPQLLPSGGFVFGDYDCP